jgi:hypothetical protein
VAANRKTADAFFTQTFMGGTARFLVQAATHDRARDACETPGFFLWFAQGLAVEGKAVRGVHEAIKRFGCLSRTDCPHGGLPLRPWLATADMARSAPPAFIEFSERARGTLPEIIGRLLPSPLQHLFLSWGSAHLGI